MSSVAQGFTKSLAMTILSEIGDKTFIAAAVFNSSLESNLSSAFFVSVIAFDVGVEYSPFMIFDNHNLGNAASKEACFVRLPECIDCHDYHFCCCWLGCSKSGTIELRSFVLLLEKKLPRTWTHHITTVLFFGFGLWSLWDGFKGDGESKELAEVEAKLDSDWKSSAGTTKEDNKDDDESKKKTRPFLAQFFSPILLKAFSITFVGEWGDKSQFATVSLAADENPFGVVLGGIVGRALCTTAAVLGGKSLASQISEKMVALSGGILFIVFGVQSFLSDVN
ncbi:GDT1-like protein 4 [Linum grandiflorum]